MRLVKLGPMTVNFDQVSYVLEVSEKDPKGKKPTKHHDIYFMGGQKAPNLTDEGEEALEAFLVSNSESPNTSRAVARDKPEPSGGSRLAEPHRA